MEKRITGDDLRKMTKGVFVLDHKRVSIPTNNTMYDCVQCREAGIRHEIIDVPGPPSEGSQTSYRGQSTTIRQCTGCKKYDGPWVPADI